MTEISDVYNELLITEQQQNESDEESNESTEKEKVAVPSLSSLFAPHQFVRCVVVEIVKGKEVEVKLSMRPTLVNAGISFFLFFIFFSLSLFLSFSFHSLSFL